MMVIAASVCHAQDAKMPLAKEFWKSPEFVKAFNGSYRINAQVEPFVTGEQRAVLVEVGKLMQGGKRADALALLKKSKGFDRSAALLYNAANISYEEGELKDAEDLYAKAIKIHPSFLRAHQNLGFCYLRGNEAAKALAAFQKAINLGANDAQVFGWFGYCYYDQKQYQAAKLAYQQAVLRAPKDTQWKSGLAFCLEALGDTQSAIRNFKELIKLEPEASTYQLELAKLYQRAGDTAKAVVLLAALDRQEKLDLRHQFLLGELFLLSGNTRLANKTLRPIMASVKVAELNDVVRVVERALSYGETDLAKAWLHELKFNLGKEVAEKSVDVRFLEAQVAILQGESDAAKKHLQFVISQEPTHQHAIVELAKLHIAGGELELGLLQLDRAMGIGGRHTAITLNLKAQALVSAKRYADALKILDKLLILRGDAEIKNYRNAVKKLAEAAE